MDGAVGNVMKRTRQRWQACPGLRRVSRRGLLRLAASLATAGLVAPGVERPGRAAPGTLQHPQDPHHPTPFEQLHLPTLTMPSFTRNGAHVPLVVEMTHPMETEHYIRSLQILNESDPIPSKGTLYLTPTNGQAYVAVQARMHSGTSSVVVIAECNQHGRWAQRQLITIPEGTGGCATVTEGEASQPIDEDLRPPLIRIPELVSGGGIRRGELIRVQVKVKHPNRTGLALREGTFLQAVEPFYLKELQVFYGERLVSRYEMTPAVSDNPFMTMKLRATEAWPLRIVLTNSRGQHFQATAALVLS